MMATRRLGHAHHEFRFGTRELVVLGGFACLIAGLVFVAGVVVGRETTHGGARPTWNRGETLGATMSRG